MDVEFASFIFVGFLAEMIDGSLGMAYGVTSTTCLLGLGLSPAAASASCHLSEVFTTAMSGLSHWWLGHVESRTFRYLAVAGVAGGVTGAYILTSLPGKIVRPAVSLYLLVMGLVILKNSFRPRPQKPPLSNKELLGLGAGGGFLDAIGGGGWGPVVTTTLLARGGHARNVIGSVNLAEFFVTVAAAATFLATAQKLEWRAIAGLILGGVVAAPLAAYVTRLLSPRVLATAVGALITGLSIWNLVGSLR
ncbi:MAG: sulfite exporter TauE/SafE family protein [Candidatus Wallbacteria bacterium]|nr:sulfite exporter TauE/SafE family protein [Candidatus Wallbacteria bacterium]